MIDIIDSLKMKLLKKKTVRERLLEKYIEFSLWYVYFAWEKKKDDKRKSQKSNSIKITETS
jgi:hypothetical protein